MWKTCQKIYFLLRLTHSIEMWVTSDEVLISVLFCLIQHLISFSFISLISDKRIAQQVFGAAYTKCLSGKFVVLLFDNDLKIIFAIGFQFFDIKFKLNYISFHEFHIQRLIFRDVVEMIQNVLLNRQMKLWKFMRKVFIYSIRNIGNYFFISNKSWRKKTAS